jgi:hypothetical protein
MPDKYTVKGRIVTSPTGARTIRFVSTGNVPSGCLQEGGQGAVATVQADITRQSTPLGAPFVGRDQIIMKKDKASTDSYNSFVGKYTSSSCPSYDAKGKPLKVLGCGGDLWTDGLAATGTATKCDKAPLCVKDGSTVFGSVTAAKGGIWIEGKKDKATGGIWGDASYDSQAGEFGSITCAKTSSCSAVVQGAIVKGAIPPINLNNVNNNYDAAAPAGCPANGAAGQDCCRTPARSAQGYTALTTLQTLLTVTDDKGVAATCSKGGKFCDYDETKGNLTIDDKGSVIVNQGQYCLNSVNIKSPLELQYDAVAKNVAPIQWNVKGLVKLDDKVAKGKSVSESENDPWLFMILSSCNAKTGCDKDKGIEVKIGTKAAGEGLYGYLYAPESGVKLNGDGDLFGAAVGRQLSVDKGSLHFDRAMLNLFEFCTKTFTSSTCLNLLPPYLLETPKDILTGWKRCVAPAGGECS